MAKAQYAQAKRLLTVMTLCGALAACGGKPEIEYDYPAKDVGGSDIGSLFSGEGLKFFSSKDEKGAPAQLGVNVFLWRAALETFSFMPLISADPVGGVIITDWYVDPSNLDERMKASIFILDRDLRADALRVTTFREQNTEKGWMPGPTAASTNRRLEDVILVRARELRIAERATSKD